MECVRRLWNDICSSLSACRISGTRPLKPAATADDDQTLTRRDVRWWGGGLSAEEQNKRETSVDETAATGTQTLLWARVCCVYSGAHAASVRLLLCELGFLGGSVAASVIKTTDF